MEKPGSGRVVVQLLTLGYTAAGAGAGSADGPGCAGHSRHHGDPVDWGSGITQTAATAELTREQRGGTLVWVGASSVIVLGSSAISPCHERFCPPSSLLANSRSCTAVAGVGSRRGGSQRGRWCVDNAAPNCGPSALGNLIFPASARFQL